MRPPNTIKRGQRGARPGVPRKHRRQSSLMSQKSVTEEGQGLGLKEEPLLTPGGAALLTPGAAYAMPFSTTLATSTSVFTRTPTGTPTRAPDVFSRTPTGTPTRTPDVMPLLPTLVPAAVVRTDSKGFNIPPHQEKELMPHTETENSARNHSAEGGPANHLPPLDNLTPSRPGNHNLPSARPETQSLPCPGPGNHKEPPHGETSSDRVGEVKARRSPYKASSDEEEEGSSSSTESASPNPQTMSPSQPPDTARQSLSPRPQSVSPTQHVNVSRDVSPRQSSRESISPNQRSISPSQHRRAENDSNVDGESAVQNTLDNDSERTASNSPVNGANRHVMGEHTSRAIHLGMPIAVPTYTSVRAKHPGMSPLATATSRVSPLATVTSLSKRRLLSSASEGASVKKIPRLILPKPITSHMVKESSSSRDHAEHHGSGSVSNGTNITSGSVSNGMNSTIEDRPLGNSIENNNPLDKSYNNDHEHVGNSLDKNSPSATDNQQGTKAC